MDNNDKKKKFNWKALLDISLYVGALGLAFVAGMLMTLEVNTGQVNYNNDQHIYDENVEIVYVDREVIVVETEYEIIEVPVYLNESEPVVPHPIATHQYYLDWVREYEDLLDDFVDELYRQTFYFDDILEDYQQYLNTKMNNGETLTPEEVDFLLEYQQRIIEWYEFEEWIDEELEPWYNDLLDRFPKDPEVE